MTNIYIKHDCKQGKQMRELGILVWAVRYTITGYIGIVKVQNGWLGAEWIVGCGSYS